MNNREIKKYDVIVVGGGITGTAITYVLNKYTNLLSIALLEKHNDFAQVNSNNTSNSQTLHFGDIETNYGLEKALVVKEAAEMVEGYLLKTRNSAGKIYAKSHKMALAVGDREIKILEERFASFKKDYPKLRLLNKEEIEKIEPMVVKGRNTKEDIRAIFSGDGYIIDYKELAKSFIENVYPEAEKNIDILLNTTVKEVTKKDGRYELKTSKGVLSAKVVVFATGAHSLLFAKSLGYGKEYFILPVAGNFYAANQRVLNGKVYTMQKEKLPFAAVHGDPDVHNSNEVRFGPTAKVVPILERKQNKTFWEFIKTTEFDWRVLGSLFRIISDKDIFVFILQNMVYDLPFIGKSYYLKNIKKVIPTADDGKFDFQKRMGGIRPQLVDKNKKELVMGIGEIVGDNIIFNVTPSPGATACLQTARNTVKKLNRFFGKDFIFKEDKMKQDFKISSI